MQLAAAFDADIMLAQMNLRSPSRRESKISRSAPRLQIYTGSRATRNSRTIFAEKREKGRP
jgi:hypothetical protein